MPAWLSDLEMPGHPQDSAEYPLAAISIYVHSADAPATAAQIAARVGVDRTVITKQATALQQPGLIQRKPHPTDARATLLDLTPDGRATTRNLRQASLEILQTLRDAALKLLPGGKLPAGPDGKPALPTDKAPAKDRGVAAKTGVEENTLDAAPLAALVVAAAGAAGLGLKRR